MDKDIYKKLEKDTFSELNRVEPIVGHWYKISFQVEGKRAEKRIRYAYKLCVKVEENDGANVCLVGVDNISGSLLINVRIFPFEVRYAEWPKTNRFHRFCHVMFYNLLGERPEKIDIFSDHKLYVLMETILLQKVIDAKTAKEALDEAKKAAKKGFGARLNHHPYGYFNPDKSEGGGHQKAVAAFEWLVKEYENI